MRIALAGNPNVGKTTLFNALTGRHQEVANWPGTTVDYATGRMADSHEVIDVIDLPGTYSLTAYSQEERVALRFLLRERPDVVIVVADATNLERNLYLVLELIEFTPKVVVALNMMDAAKRQGLRVDVQRLRQLLGVPVVPTIAARSFGLSSLIKEAKRVAAGPAEAPEPPVVYPGWLCQGLVAPLTARVAALPEVGHHAAKWLALQLVQGDEEVFRYVAQLPGGGEVARLAGPSAAAAAGGRVATFARPADGNGVDPGPPRPQEIALIVADARYTFIAEVLRAVARRPPWRRDQTERLDGLFLHPLLGYAIMGAVFASGFWLAFVASAPLSARVDRALVAAGGATAAATSSLGLPVAVRSLVAQGIFPGVGAVLSFVPYMAVFFVVYQFLQDTGYMARASVLVDRFMERIGLHGKGFFALVSAYGCNVPALSATRVMENPRDRLLANLVIPFIPCNARLGVMAVMTAAFFPGPGGALAMIGLLLISVATLTSVTWLYRRTILPTDPAPLVLELPQYHWPSLRNVLFATWHRVWLFLSRIWWYLIWATLAIWALTYFPVGAPLAQSWAGRLGHALAIFGGHYGFDWRLMVAILFGFVAKETTLSTLGVLFGAGQGYLSLSHALTSAMTPLVAFTYLVVYMLYVPCLSTVVQMRRESGGWGWAGLGVAVNVLVAFAVGLIVERVGVLLGFS